MLRRPARILLGLALASGLNGAGVATQAASLAAVIIVNSAADVVDDDPGDGTCETAPGNGVCTLRAAVQEANGLGGANTVLLPALAPGSSYLFTLVGGGEQAAATGDLDITSQLTLRGAGATLTVIDANGPVTDDRVFEIQAGAALTLTGVTVRYGRHPGNGAGLRNFGRLTLSDSVVISNTLTGPSPSDTGGGLSNEAAAVSDIQRVVFQNNVSSGHGGAIYNSGSLTISASLIVSNSAVNVGGGILNSSGTTVIHNTSLKRNTAAGGGGFSMIGANGTLVLHGTAVLSNTALIEGGGGWLDNGNRLVVRNSTISGNEGRDHGGGLYVSTQTTTTLMNVTVTGNAADVGGVGGGLYISSGAVVNMRNSLLSGNVHRTGGLFAVFDDCVGSLTSQDYNLVRTLTNCTITGPDTPGLLGVTPTGLGSLGQHGGPTLTLELQAGSNLVDAANPTGCTDEFGAPLTTDQRGFAPRAADGDNNLSAICDIGAFELGAMGPVFLPLALR